MLENTSIAFQDSFDSKTPIKDARGWLYQILTKAAVKWVETEGSGAVNVTTIDEYGSQKKEDVSLKEIKLKEWMPKFDKDWLPELWDADDVQAFQMKIGDRLLEKLEHLFAVSRYLTIKLNDSLIIYTKKKNDKSDDNPSEETKKKRSEDFKKLKEDAEKYKKFPLEKFLHGVIIKDILEKVSEHEKTVIDKEYEELYADEDKAEKAKKKSKNLPGSRPDPKDKK